MAYSSSKNRKKTSAKGQTTKKVNSTKKSNTRSKKKTGNEIPQTISESIPYLDVYEGGNAEGIIRLKEKLYSKSYLLPDSNFRTSDEDRQEKICRLWGSFLGKFDDDMTVELTMYNRTVNISQFQQNVMMEAKQDNLNEYRDEYNQMLLNKMTGAKNNLKTEKYLTISLPARDVAEAAERFEHVDDLFNEDIPMMTNSHDASGMAKPLTTIERLEILNSIYNLDDTHPLYMSKKIGKHVAESFTLQNCANQGITTKDVIAPEIMSFSHSRDFQIGTYIGRTFYISSYPTWVKGSVFTDFTSLPCNSLVSIYFNLIPQDEAIKQVRRQTTNISANIVDAQKKASKAGYDSQLIAPDTVDAREEAREIMESLTKDNARLYVGNMVITIFAKSEEQLSKFEANVKSESIKNLLTNRVLNTQQEQGFNSSLPLANNQLKIQRLMTTESVSGFVPFNVKEINQRKGMYYGQNAVTRSMIMYDRTTDLNPNGCILGMPGAGKSFAAKREIINVLLNTQDPVYIIDPEREYTVLAEKLGGSVIKMANGSTSYINPFDLHLDNKDEDSDASDPVKVKCEFIESICEIMVGGRFGLSAIEKSIIDRCVINIYEEYLHYLKENDLMIAQDKAPTMREFWDELCAQPQPEAQSLALGLEKYVRGSSDIFSHHTNLNLENRFIVYDIKDIGVLTELGLQICLDNVWNEMVKNKSKGKRTWFYIDEFYLMMKKPTSASYLSQIWKRARKWDGVPTAITQNVEDMIKSEEARTIINNSSFIMMLSQSAINRQQLSSLLNISAEEQKYISQSKQGMGLLRIGEDIIPFDDNFPKNTELYKIMSTKPQEDL